MVTIKSFRKNKSTDGKEFISLELESGVELVMSPNTGKWYATTRRIFISSTFDADVAERIVGSTIPGTIVRIQCDPYDYTIKATGEVIKLSHVFEFQPEDTSVMAKRELELA